MNWFLTEKTPIKRWDSASFAGVIIGYFLKQKRECLEWGATFNYAECLNCGSLQLENIPEDLSPYYSNAAYYSFSKLNKSDLKTRILKNIRMRGFMLTNISELKPRYGYWLKKVHNGFGAKIADVGCGNGQLLYELYSSGYRDLHGFDPFIEKTERINSSLQLNKKKIEETDLKFDLIMMHHSFEHLESASQILEVCFEKLNSGGKLLVRTPVTDGEVWKTKRELWVQLDAPRHLIIPSVHGFRVLAEKIGFRLNEVEFDSTGIQFWGTALYEKGLPLDQLTLGEHFDLETIKNFTEKATKFNQEGKGDQVCFYLTKGK